ncbi:MAG: hypothetical protein V1900_02245 [Candidatus Aenigmatarchaeota archaeon]
MKGINPLIASVMLIAITVLLSAVILNWITTLTKQQGATISNKTTDCSMADITVAEVYIDIASNRSRVAVRNSGFTDDSIASAILMNAQGEPCPNLTVFPISFPVGSLQTLVFNITGKMTACANFSQAMVSTRCTNDKFYGNPKCV